VHHVRPKARERSHETRVRRAERAIEWEVHARECDRGFVRRRHSLAGGRDRQHLVPERAQLAQRDCDPGVLRRFRIDGRLERKCDTHGRFSGADWEPAERAR
jgi:hypothetical protein